MLTLVKKNRFGDCQYKVADDGSIAAPSGAIWTIRNADEQLQRCYPGSVLREYNGVNYLLSARAAEVIPRTVNLPYSGSACILTVNNTLILLADNKPYIQNCQGMRKEDETDPAITMARELEEELKISVNPDRFKQIGYWTFVNNIDLVDTSMASKTILFSLSCTAQEVAHLTTDLDKFQVIKFTSDEVVFVVAIPDNQLESIPEQIEGKSFTGHHREALRQYLGMTPKYSTSYLKEFKINAQ